MVASVQAFLAPLWLKPKLTGQELADQLAARGQVFLDRECPGWDMMPEFDDLSTLDISSDRHCVLGKIFGHYEEGLCQLAVNEKQESRRGFWTDGRNGVTMHQLTVAHRQHIKRRREQYAIAQSN